MADSLLQKNNFIITSLSGDVSNKKKTNLDRINGFIKSPIGTILAGLISTTLIGGLTSHYFSEYSRNKSEISEQIVRDREARSALTNRVSENMFSRRLSIGLINSAIMLGAPKKDIQERWDIYQLDTRKYQTSMFSIRLEILNYLQRKNYNAFVHVMREDIEPSFGRLDKCVTPAYRMYQKSLVKAAQNHLLNCVPRIQESDRPYFNRSAKAEIDRLQKCFGGFQVELTEAINIENLVRNQPEKTLWEYVRFQKDKKRELMRLREDFQNNLSNQLKKSCDDISEIKKYEPVKNEIE